LFLEARDAFISVVSLPRRPSQLIEQGKRLVKLLAERPRKRINQRAHPMDIFDES
jgi:hypothetical protein